VWEYVDYPTHGYLEELLMLIEGDDMDSLLDHGDVLLIIIYLRAL